MSIVRDNIPRVAALCLAVCGLYIFINGANDRQLRVLDDGSLADPYEKSLVGFKYPRSILSVNVGFERYRSICYGLSSFCLLLDLILGSGHLTIPALFISAGEIVNDFSDFLVAIFLIGKNIGIYPAAAYGLTYLTLLTIETMLWLGTCKYHENCQLANVKHQMQKKKQLKLSHLKNIKT